jgi:hypothetical protein
MIEGDLNCAEESATKSTYKLGVGLRDVRTKVRRVLPNFFPSSNYHKEEETIKSIKAHYLSNPKPSFNTKREVRKGTPKLR